MLTRTGSTFGRLITAGRNDGKGRAGFVRKTLIRIVASLGDEAGDSPVGGGSPTGGDPASLARLLYTRYSPATTNPTLSGFLVSYQPPQNLTSSGVVTYCVRYQQGQQAPGAHPAPDGDCQGNGVVLISSLL